MSVSYVVQGHAIVSADDRIADASGITPPELRNETDWSRFQTALDAAAVTVLGRLGHFANPNTRHRNRLVLSSQAEGIEWRSDAWWWNPKEASFDEALARSAPQGGTVAVTGGRQVFDLFLDFGFDAFDLARATRVDLPGGVPIFSAVGGETSANDVLRAHGLVPTSVESFDPAAGVTLALWRRP